MEIRKLQKVGSSTLSVSLPSGWASQVGLKRGATVQLVEDGKELRLIPLMAGAAPTTKETRYLIAADECKSTGVLARLIISAYVLGRDHLIVRSSSRLNGEEVEAIRRVSKRLMGLGIMQEDPDEIVLQCSIESQRYPVEALFKRLYNLSATTITDSLEAMRTRDAKLAHAAASREEDSDMIYWLLMRQILSAQQDESVRTLVGIKSRADVSGYSIIAADLERIGDHTRHLAAAAAWLIENKVKIPGAIQTALRSYALEVGAIFQSAMLALLSRELEKSVDAIERAGHLREKEEGLVLSLLAGVENRDAVIRLRRAIQGLVNTAEACRSIAIIAFSRHQSEPTRFMRPIEPGRDSRA